MKVNTPLLTNFFLFTLSYKYIVGYTCDKDNCPIKSREHRIDPTKIGPFQIWKFQNMTKVKSVDFSVANLLFLGKRVNFFNVPYFCQSHSQM